MFHTIPVNWNSVITILHFEANVNETFTVILFICFPKEQMIADWFCTIILKSIQQANIGFSNKHITSFHRSEFKELCSMGLETKVGGLLCAGKLFGKLLAVLNSVGTYSLSSCCQ